MMNEENMMDDKTPQTARSESAFSGMSNEIRRLTMPVAPQKRESNVLFLPGRENQIFRASRYGHATALLIPLRLLPEHSSRNDVLEASLFRIGEPTKLYQLYTTHKPGYTRAYLDIAQLGANYGDQYDISEVKLYRPAEFAVHYNAFKPKGLENTELEWNGGFLLRVDGTELKLQQARFRTYQGMVILDAELGEARSIKIQKKLGSFEVRLRDHSPVTRLQVLGQGIVLSYQRTDHDEYTHRRQVTGGTDPTEAEVPRLNLALEVKVIGKPSKPGEPYTIEASEATARKIREELGKPLTIDQFRNLKGRIAEELVALVVPQLGMDLVTIHPVTPKWWQSESKKPGPDLLARVVVGRELTYVEVKWWGKVRSAIRKAISQLTEGMRRHPTYKGEKVASGYAAVISWEAESNRFELHFLQAPTNS